MTFASVKVDCSISFSPVSDSVFISCERKCSLNKLLRTINSLIIDYTSTRIILTLLCNQLEQSLSGCLCTSAINSPKDMHKLSNYITLFTVVLWTVNKCIFIQGTMSSWVLRTCIYIHFCLSTMFCLFIRALDDPFKQRS